MPPFISLSGDVVSGKPNQAEAISDVPVLGKYPLTRDSCFSDNLYYVKTNY